MLRSDKKNNFCEPHLDVPSSSLTESRLSLALRVFLKFVLLLGNLVYSNQCILNLDRRTMSESGFSTVEKSLEDYIPTEELKEVKRILYGQSEELVF